MKNTSAAGDRTEGVILARLLQLGKVVLFPFGNSQRYDLVVHEGGVFTRGQCKTAKRERGCIVFKTSSIGETRAPDGTRRYTRRGYEGEIDMFYVYSPELDKVYAVPVGEVPCSEGRLLVEPSSNAKTKSLRLASDYEI